ncbi:hypothetical protein G7043_25125 [Lentzea sp. NEAU-D13]|uniref:Uncharacterized protein n=1 Tax=Lentzea alba TaxID=2714351 RepID=A0A7C9VQX7_9PSEU|nr:hypothetical protein [Lentzea alba]NGY62214.1 hypothetical protein [Lentzea alba]
MVLPGCLTGKAAMTTNSAVSYRRSSRHELGRHLRQTDALARLTSTPQLVDLATTAARDHQRAFDDLVETGLGAGTISSAFARVVVGKFIEASNPFARA